MTNIISITSIEKCHEVSNKLREELIPLFLSGIEWNKINDSYNVIRKVIDLCFGHLTSMSEELSEHRNTIIPNLPLPLDKQILMHPYVFSDEVIERNAFTRCHGFSFVEKEESYLDFQNEIRNKCDELKKLVKHIIHPIYFDLLWGKRMTNSGSNLFEIN